MTRRRVLAQFGGALGAWGLSAVIPATAGAQNCFCFDTGGCDDMGGCCDGCTPCQTTSGCYCVPNDETCCKDPQSNFGFFTCPRGDICCGHGDLKQCCDPRNEFCASGKCVRACPPGEEQCNGICCPSGQACVNGTCQCTRELCASQCCPDGSMCCDFYRDQPAFCCSPQTYKQLGKKRAGEISLHDADLSANYSIAAAGTFLVPPASAVLSLAAAIMSKRSTAFARANADPPDSNYRSIFRPRAPRLPRVRSGHGINAAAAQALNKMLTNEARGTEFLVAATTSIERAQGAANAQNPQWVIDQVKAAADFADQAADACSKDVSLRHAARAALEKAGVKEIRITEAEARAAQHKVRSHGLPKQVLSLAHRLQLDASELRDMKTHILLTPAHKLAGPVLLAPLTNPRTLRLLKQNATELHAYARAARHQQIAPVPGSTVS